MIPHRTFATRAVLALATLAAHASAQIVTENAGVQSPQTPEFHEVLGYTRSEHGSEVSATHEFVVGLDRVDELRLAVPMAWRRFTTAGVDADTFGVGDATLRWKRALWRADDVMESQRWSLLAALTAPTGDDTSTADGVTIPPDVRASRGDWTFGLGTVFTLIADRQRFSAELTFRHRTSHDGFQLGESLDLNLAYWYRLTPAAFVDVEHTTEVRGVVELLTSYRWDSHDAGSSADDGGVLIWFAPGVQVFPTDWCLLQANVELPLVQTIDDTWGDRRFAATLTLKFLF